MKRETDMQLMRLLHGELDESAARKLRQRLAVEPDLGRRFRDLERQWQTLDLPEPKTAPPGYSTRILARVRQEADRGIAPVWWSQTWAGKLATAAVLAAGIAFGAILASPSEAEDWTGFLDDEPSLAESYLILVDQPEAESWQENGS